MAITRTRFAPSPTGMLHLGHVYAAMFAHNLAAENNGECLLRFEDIDITRVRPEYYQAIVDDLSYLGLSFPKPYLKQTLRNKNYQQALEKLKQLNLVYPCFCSRILTILFHLGVLTQHKQRLAILHLTLQTH